MLILNHACYFVLTDLSFLLFHNIYLEAMLTLVMWHIWLFANLVFSFETVNDVTTGMINNDKNSLIRALQIKYSSGFGLLVPASQVLKY